MNDIVPPTGKPASSGLIERVTAILTKPAPTWDVIATEPSTVQSIYMGYVVPLAAIGPVARAIGSVVFGVGAFGFSYHTPILAAAVGAVIGYVLSLVMIYVIAFIIDALAPSFDGQKNMVQAFKVAAYTSTAGWVASILGILPSLGILAGIVGGLYGLYLMYVGLPKLMKSPAEKTIVYMIVIAVVGWVAAFAVGIATTSVAGLGMLGAGAMSPMAHIGQADTSGQLGGKVTIPGMGSVDLGKAQEAANRMEAAASAAQNGQPVKTIDPQALVDLMPASFGGAARSDLSSGSDSLGNGIAASHASATYAVNGGTINLSVADTGATGLISGMGALAQAANINHTENTATGYEKLVTENGRAVSEKYDNANKSGSYSIMYGGRITVSADGNGVDMNTIKSLVQQVDAGRAEALAK
jgi:hypothetical protein